MNIKKMELKDGVTVLVYAPAVSQIGVFLLVALVALVCSFRANGKNRRHHGCRNVMRSKGRAVQNKGITLRN